MSLSVNNLRVILYYCRILMRPAYPILEVLDHFVFSPRYLSLYGKAPIIINLILNFLIENFEIF